MHNDLKAIQFFNGNSKEKAENLKNETNGMCAKFQKQLYLKQFNFQNELID